MQRTRVGVFFGGQSPEHEVSVITGLQAVSALNPTHYEVTPVYVSKAGHWFIGEGMDQIERYSDLPSLFKTAREVAVAPGPGRTLSLVGKKRSLFQSGFEQLLDVAFLAFHGGPGENGAIQGLCEAMNVPYTGSAVMASSIGMDKIMSKKVCQMAGVPVVEWVELWEKEWRGEEEKQLAKIEQQLGFPAIVKPVRLGSSIGIKKVETALDLDGAIEEAFRYDASVVIETCISPLREINCSVLGNRDNCRVSVLEEPVSAEGFLSFKDKYMRQGPGEGKVGGAKSFGVERGEEEAGGTGMASLDRLIPAPISKELAEQIEGLAKSVFKALDCSGLVRIDFLMNDKSKQVWFNEINTIPGSLSFYLWKPAGIPFDELVQKLVELALEKFEDRSRRVRSYEVNLLAGRSGAGLKGGLKGTKS